jgi:hypothetical protein
MSAFRPVIATVHRRPPSSTALLVGLSLLGALLGAVLALAVGDGAGDAPGRTTPPPAPRAVAAGDLRLTLPAGWRAARSGPAVPEFAGVRTAFARGPNADVAMALLPAASPSLLPWRLDAARRSLPSSRPRVARAGSLRAYHYVLAAKGERVIDVLAVPTTQGIATIVCSSTAPVPGECDVALRGLRLARGAFVPLNADAAFLARLPAVALTLDARRVRLRTQLARASLPETAVRIVARLAETYAAATSTLRPLVARGSEAAATVRLLDGLRVRYGGLAATLRTGDRAAFAAIALAIDLDEARLVARLEGWQRVALPGSG